MLVSETQSVCFFFFFSLACCGEESERVHLNRCLTGVPEEADEVFR